MPDENVSRSNAQKLDHLLQRVERINQLIEGEEDAPGVLARLALMEAVMFGKHGKEGLATKVNFMWKIYVWVLCTLSGVIGYLFREMILKWH